MKLDRIYTLECLERAVREPLTEAIRNHYGAGPANPVPDGQIHRFDIDKRGDKVGWYVFFEDTDFSCAIYGNWKTGDQNKWQSSNNLTEEQHYRLECHMAEVEKETRHTQEIVAETARKLYASSDSAKQDHPYLVKKQVGVDTYLTQMGDRLVLPLFNEKLEIVSLQYITADGKKQFLKGGQMSGCFCPVGFSEDYKGLIYIAEGYATAKSIQEATGKACFVAFNAGNLPKVAESLKDWTDYQFTIVADNDESGTGEKYAKESGLPYKLIPRVGMDANDYAVAGYDLKEFLESTSESDSPWLVSASDFIDSYKPSSWIIKNWIPRRCMIMIYGKSGCGKTFTLVDQLLTISTGQPDWFGSKVKKGNVVYLAGEGHEGLRKRLKLWSQKHNINDFGNFFIAKSALDLDRLEGLQKTAQQLQQLPFKPDIIAVDTLNRFFSGDENSAQEARGFIESCTELQRLFECSIVIVHHSGVSENAQERMRGSSAFRGALDTEILVSKDDNGFITLKQTKQKDIDPMPDLELRLKGYKIDGWYDEDGEQLTSAVIELPDEEDRKAKISEEIALVCDVYRSSAKVHDANDYPFISRMDLKDYLMEKKGMTAAKAKNAMRNEPYRLVGKLVSNNILTASETGWTISDLDTAQALLFEEIV